MSVGQSIGERKFLHADDENEVYVYDFREDDWKVLNKSIMIK